MFMRNMPEMFKPFCWLKGEWVKVKINQPFHVSIQRNKHKMIFYQQMCNHPHCIHARRKSIYSDVFAERENDCKQLGIVDKTTYYQQISAIQLGLIRLPQLSANIAVQI